MKKVLFLLMISMTLAFTSCMDDNDTEDQYWSLGVVSSTSNGLTILNDSKDTLYSNSIPSDFTAFVGQRVYVIYKLVKEGTSLDAYDYLISIDAINEVLTKSIVTLTDVNRDTIGSDPVVINSLWIGRNYLNVDFRFYASVKKHYFNVVYDPLNQDVDGAVVLEFRHKDYDDGQNYVYSGLISYDLSTLGWAGTAPHKIVLRYTNYNSVVVSTEMQYTPEVTVQ